MTQPLGQPQTGLAITAGGQHDELPTTPAAEEVCFSHVIFHLAGQSRQHSVAQLVTIAVVDLFEGAIANSNRAMGRQPLQKAVGLGKCLLHLVQVVESLRSSSEEDITV
ncbi:hypothetical protein QLQ86_18670 [Halomonas sp. LR5S13]|nr:hypothetical protein [Halomonas rhizosphaerae]MDI5922792.1 hypothetical protein [Halomonas rhizosphaerae]